MNEEKIKQRIGELQLSLEAFLSQNPEQMKCAVARYKKLPKRHGVYAVSDSEDKEIIYIGISKSAKNGIGQRLSNHFGTQALKRYGATRKMVEAYLVRVFEEENFTARRNLEGFAIGVFSPKFNRD